MSSRKNNCNTSLSLPVTIEFLGDSTKFITRSNETLSTFPPNHVRKSTQQLFLFPQKNWVRKTPPTTSSTPKLLPASTSVHTPTPIIEHVSSGLRKDVNSLTEGMRHEQLGTVKFGIDFPKLGNRNYRIVNGELISSKERNSEENHDHPATKEQFPLLQTYNRHIVDTRRLFVGETDFLSDRMRRFCLDEYISRGHSVNNPVSNISKRLPRTPDNVFEKKICVIGSDGKWDYLNHTEL